MEYRKERNFIVAYEGDKCRGKYDIQEGKYYGVKGTAVKSIPHAFNYSMLEGNDNLCARVVTFARRYEWGLVSEVARGKNRRSRLEALLSVGLLPNDLTALDSTTRLTKELVSYLKENYHGIYNVYAVEDWNFERVHAHELADLDENGKRLFKDFICREHEIPAEYVLAMIRQCTHEHTDLLYENTYRLIKDFYAVAHELYGEVKVKPNVLSNFAQLRYVQKERKRQEMAKTIAVFNDAPWLYFETDKYIIRPLLTPDEFHAEGEAQHNCVEWMYMERVADKQTHVVVVRSKDNPNKSLITCEVSNSGRIIQYLAACNSRVMVDEQIALRELYQAHLVSSLLSQGDA